MPSAISHPHRFKRSLLCLLTASALTACGGGSSGEDNGGAGGGGNATPGINAQNVEQRASATYQIADAFFTTGLSSSELLFSGKSVAAAGRTDPVDPELGLVALQWAHQQLQRAAGIDPRAGARVGKAVRSDSLPCPDGGSMVMTLDDVDNDEILGPGDAFTIEMRDCRTGVERSDGQLRMQDFSLLAQGTTSQAGATFVFTNLSYSDGTYRETIHGSFTMAATYQSAPSRTVISTITGTSLAVTLRNTVNTLRDFSMTSTIDIDNALYSFSMAARITDSAAGASAQISTPQTITSSVGAYPQAGQLKVVESDGSGLRIVAMPPDQVRVDLDANGDGVYESSQTTRWEALEAKL